MHERRASMALLGGAVIAMLATLTAVAVDLGTVYLAKTSDQRAADSAAYAGALAYNSTSSTTTMNSAVSNLAALNGLPAGAAAASLVPSPSGDGNSAVKVTVTTAAPLYLAEIFQSGKTLSVSATSYAEVKPNASACIIALKAGGSGVTLAGGTAITAASCAVASDATVTVPCGTTITTKTLDYNSAAVPSQPCSGIKPPAGTTSVNIIKVVTPDPLATNTAVSGAFTHLASVASLAGPAGPVVAAGTSITFANKTTGATSPPVLLTAMGCPTAAGALAGSTWTITCPAGGTYHFGTISLNGGITLNLSAVGGATTNTYDFSGAIDLSSGAGGSFGPGTYNVAGGIITGGGSTFTFGAGTYKIGTGTVKCSGSFYSICNNGTSLTFGAGSYTIAGGICNCDSGTLSIGAGSSANSFNIGAGSAGYAINAPGTTTLGDMASGTFQAVGKISTPGGTNFKLSAAPTHDLNGTFALAGQRHARRGNLYNRGQFHARRGRRRRHGHRQRRHDHHVRHVQRRLGLQQRDADRSRIRNAAGPCGRQQRGGRCQFLGGRHRQFTFRCVLLSERADHAERRRQRWQRRRAVPGADRVHDHAIGRIGARFHLLGPGGQCQRRLGAAGAMSGRVDNTDGGRARRLVRLPARLWRRRQGTAAIEMALIAPLLLTLFAGIIDFARVYDQEIELSSAVAAAAQYALINVASINSGGAATLASMLSGIVANSNGTNWAGATVTVNNGATNTLTNGTPTSSGTAANANSCFCPTGTSPAAWSFGAVATCGSACAGGTLAGKFVTIAGTRAFNAIFGNYGLIGNITLHQSIVVQAQ